MGFQPHRLSWKGAALMGIVALLLAACGDDSGSNGPEPDVVKIENKSISGVSQKGPFVRGSAVKLYELDRHYAQTGRSFTGKITSDDGKFSVSNVTLSSQYALLEATGYFRNEISGEQTESTITLNALTDLSDRETVNINLLTHLEYERAIYLVDAGLSVKEAKKQAEKEIFNAFGFQGDFSNSEDLDIFSSGEDNAALLAINVLLLKYLGCEFDFEFSGALFTETLSKFATDIEKDGKWDDEITKAKIADCMHYEDGSGRVRSNIEEWNLGVVPDFEKYVHNFWVATYGLGTCDKSNEGEVVSSKNENSCTYSSRDRFICKGGTWDDASYREKDFYKSGKDKGADGEVWTGPVTGQKYMYDEQQGVWQWAWVRDDSFNEYCTRKQEGTMTTDNVGDLYYCAEFGWDTDDTGDTVYSYKWENLKVELYLNVPKELRLNPEITYGTMTDTRDNKTYKTVKIGELTWMAENLNYADSVATPSLKGKSWCYDDIATNCDVAGRLYTWAAAIDSAKLYKDKSLDCGYGKDCTLPDTVYGICPPGWHLPNNEEWNNLLFVAAGVKGGSDVYASMALKSRQGGWGGRGENSDNGTDAVGFSALPAGFWDSRCSIRKENDEGEEGYDGVDCWDGRLAYFWSASHSSKYKADFMSLSSFYDEYLGSDFGYDDSNKNYAFSIRCVENSK